jgi:hypothetical protein
MRKLRAGHSPPRALGICSTHGAHRADDSSFLRRWPHDAQTADAWALTLFQALEYVLSCPYRQNKNERFFELEPIRISYLYVATSSVCLSVFYYCYTAILHKIASFEIYTGSASRRLSQPLAWSHAFSSFDEAQVLSHLIESESDRLLR